MTENSIKVPKDEIERRPAATTFTYYFDGKRPGNAEGRVVIAAKNHISPGRGAHIPTAYRTSPTTCYAGYTPNLGSIKWTFPRLLSLSYCNFWKTERKSASDLDVVSLKSPADLLSSQAMQDPVAELRLKYDYILMDASPLQAVVDPLTLVPIADKIVMIIEWGRTSRTNFSEALKTLSLIRHSISGIVLNKGRLQAAGELRIRGLVKTILNGPRLRAIRIGKY
jgi:hypothetical protein